MDKSNYIRVEALKKVGMLTGSVRFGCDNPQDEDYLIRRGDWSRIVGNHLNGMTYDGRDYQEEGNFKSFHLNFNGIKYNFIVPVDDAEFEKWRKSTLMMCKVPVRFIQNKYKRTELFEAFKELFEEPERRPLASNNPPPMGDDIPF